jgi:hypothetical protein
MLEEDQGGSMGRRLKINAALNGLAALMLGGALVAGSHAVALADVAATANAASLGQVCTSVIVKVRAKHWVWVKATRKSHGRRVFVRRHGKIVLVHVRVSYLRVEPHQLCTVTPLAALTPPSPLAPSALASSAQSAVVTVLQPPINSGLPSINGTPASGQTVMAGPGAWSGSPTEYAYQWQRCNSTGVSCSPVSGATAQAYILGSPDVGSTLRVAVTASNTGGASAPATSVQTTVVAAQPRPQNTSPPTITGTAQEGQALAEAHGTWTNEPTTDTYQWLQCDSSGASCAAIAGATSQSYVPVAGDVGNTISVEETASNEGGSGSATSNASAVVAGPPVPVNTAPPVITGSAQQGQTLTEVQGTWTGEPTGYAYQWLQCDSLGSACLPMSGATSQTYVPVAADVGHTLKAQETASNAGGAGSPALSEATAKVVALPPPVNTAPPAITGTAQQGQTLTAQNGSWTNEPTSFAYDWQRCDSTGANCAPISGATASTYVLGSPDAGSTLRASVIATNGGGESEPAISAQSAVVGASSAISHLEYVVQDGVTSVYDMDHEFKLLKTISLPQTKAEVRGVTVAPSTHLMFISFGGDGGQTGNGSVLAYDLVSEQVLWEVHLSTGIDSGQVSPDGKKLYMPIGENSSGNIWNILSTENGAVIGTIKGGSGPHNTVASPDGGYVYLGGRASNMLNVY